MLAEFRLTHARLVRVVATLRRVPVVVDHFIGLHETLVDDWGTVRAGGARARRLAREDRRAVEVADLCITDTAARAQAITLVGGRPVLPLPVGAPEWARPLPARVSDGALRILYYGNYLPLHGVDLVIDALAALPSDLAWSATFIGDGPRRRDIEDRVRRAGIAARCTFVDPVDESALADHIARHDVVLGVFGRSVKARTVVPNKVWQGLACGRVVVTQYGPAVRELTDVADASLVLTTPGDVASIGAALLGVAARPPRTELDDARAVAVSARLGTLMTERFDRFGAALLELVA